MILVLLFHWPFSYLHLELGWIGVNIFFVLSGYLITRILVAEKRQPLKIYLKRFYLKRILRIFPLYYLYLLGLVVVGLVLGDSLLSTEIFRNLPFLLSYTYNYSSLFALLNEVPVYDSRLYVHLWSLSVEEQFYLVFPFCVFFLSKKYLRVLLIAIIISVPVLRWLIWELLHSSADPLVLGKVIYDITLTQADSLAFGALMVVGKGEIKALFKYRIILFSLFFVIGLINGLLIFPEESMLRAFALGYEIPDHYLIRPKVGNIVDYRFVYNLTIVNIGSTVLLLSLLNQTWASRIFLSRTLVWIGKISYGVYVLHFVINLGLVKVYEILGSRELSLLEESVVLLIYLAVTLVVSWVSYHFYERRFLNLKSKIT